MDQIEKEEEEESLQPRRNMLTSLIITIPLTWLVNFLLSLSNSLCVKVIYMDFFFFFAKQKNEAKNIFIPYFFWVYLIFNGYEKLGFIRVKSYLNMVVDDFKIQKSISSYLDSNFILEF